MKIFDCFTYFNEVEMLRVRFEELGSIVDYFVIVEASETFTGKPKPFYLDDLPKWAKKWKQKIINVRIDFSSSDLSLLKDAWQKEHYQRNAIKLGLTDAQPEDIIIISDADEIVKSSILKKISSFNTPARLDVKQYFWNYHWQAPQHCNQGARPIIARYKDLDDYSCQELRSGSWYTIPDAGWHFSFFTEIENVKNKIESFAHTEYNIEEYKNDVEILYRINNGIDPFDRFPLKYQQIDKSYPNWVYKNYR
jgi:beta-1,4-mannosyl-glycoprotein beta-1,4-N-acetylglucosaminyltransferase